MLNKEPKCLASGVSDAFLLYRKFLRLATSSAMLNKEPKILASVAFFIYKYLAVSLEIKCLLDYLVVIK